MHRLGPYTLLTRIGVGGMAEIFLARRGDQVVALKRILPHLAEHDDFVDMFVDEARLAAKLRHPNIARVLEVGREDGLWFIAMEYVPGEDLLTIIRTAREKHMPTPLAVGASIIADAAAALHHAHDLRDEDGTLLGLVHRDVTPSNLIVSHEGDVKLVDFGIAKAERRVSVTAAGALKGKYAYMAPEHALGETLDRRADVFSLGVVAWETFTQRRLFHREHELAVLRAVTEERIPIPSERRGDLPAELDEIIMRALDRDRATRWPTARHMEAALRRFVSSRLEGEPRHAIADLMDQLFGITVAEKRRRWAAGDLDDEPATNVEKLTSPAPVLPRSRVPDLDEDDAATRVADEPRDMTGRTEIDARAVPPGDDDDDDDDLDPQTTVVPLRRPVNGASPMVMPARPSTPLRAPAAQASGTLDSPRGGALPRQPRPPQPRVTPSRAAFPVVDDHVNTTEPVPLLDARPSYLRASVVVWALAAGGLAVWLAVRPARDDGAGEPAALPRLASPRPESGATGVPAELEAPQLGGEPRLAVPVPRPGQAVPAVAQLGFEGPEGASITLDGERLGTLPLPRRSVAAGSHTVIVAGPLREYVETFQLQLAEGEGRIEAIRVDPDTLEVVHHQVPPRSETPGAGTP